MRRHLCIKDEEVADAYKEVEGCQPTEGPHPEVNAMNGRIWEKIKEYARRYVAFRIIALVFVVPYIVVRDIVKWVKASCADTSLRRRVAAACAVCLALTTAFSGHAYLVFAEGDAIVVENADQTVPADETAGNAEVGSEEGGDQTVADDPAAAEQPQTDPEVKPEEGAQPGVENPDGNKDDTSSQGEVQPTEVPVATEEPVIEVSLMTDIVSPLGTQYEKVAVSDIVDGEAVAPVDVEQDYLYVLGITNQGDKDVSGITVSSEAFDFIYKRSEQKSEEPQDGTFVISSLNKARKNALRKCTVSDAIPAGETAYVAMIAVKDDGIFKDDEGNDVYDFDIGISVSGKKVVSHNVTADLVHEMQSFRAEREAAGVDFTIVDEAGPQDDAVSGPAADIDDAASVPEPTEKPAEVVPETAVADNDDVDADTAKSDESDDAPEAVTGTAAETGTSGVGEIIEEPDEDKKEEDNGIISVTLPTSFDIPMFNRDNSLEVVSDDISIRNRSEFPIDVKITSVNVSIKQSVDNKIYSTKLCTNNEYVYDLDEIAAHSDLDLHLYTGDNKERIYDLSEGENTDVASFSLAENRDEADDTGTAGGSDEAAVNLRGTLMNGIFLPGMRCDLKVQVVFDFNRAVSEEDSSLP